MSSPIKPDSRRQSVFRYMKDHPILLTLDKFSQNAKLYEAFKASSKSDQNTIRRYKTQFLDIVEDGLGKDYKKELVYSLKKSPKPKKYEDGHFDKFALNPDKISIWELADLDLIDLFTNFVGFIGFIDAEGRAVIEPTGEIHKGEALPEPVDEITDEYMGIQQYQAEAIITYRDNHNILNIWSRGFGKTWKSAWIIQLDMKYECDKFLYLSLTDVAFIVANWIYLWAQNNDAIIIDSVEKVKSKKKLTGRKDSYKKFSLVNGARLEIHGVRTTSTLGYHGWIIIKDDVIDREHKRLPQLQKSLETRWNSQYSKIRRKKLVMDNTRKFEGDYFDFLIEQFEKKGKAFKKRKGYLPDKYKLFIDLKTPYTELAYSGDIAGYRQFITDMNADKIPYDTNNILAPWYEADDFEIMKLEDWESFNAEMLGNPKALEGGMVKPSDIMYVASRPHITHGVQVGGTGVDCASTEDEANDFTAIESCLMAGVMNANTKSLDKQFTFYRSDVKRILARNVESTNENDPYDWIDDDGKKIRRGIIETVQWHWRFHRINYQGVMYIVAWERNNAGIAIMEQALRSFRNQEKVEIQNGIWEVLDWPRFLIPDPNQAKKWKKGAKHNVRLGITQYLDKKTRIYGQLQYPIKHKIIRFTENQRDSIGMSQLLSYPRGKHDDSPDAKGMIKDELNRRWNPGSQPKKTRAMLVVEKQQSKFAKKFKETMMEPWRKSQRKKSKRFM